MQTVMHPVFFVCSEERSRLGCSGFVWILHISIGQKTWKKEKKKKDDNTCNLSFHYNLPNKVDTVIKALVNIHLFGKFTFSYMEAESVL